MNTIMKKLKNLLLTLILLIFIFNLDIVLLSTKQSCILFINKIFISIFPFIILSDILIYYDYHIFLKNIFGNFLSKIFNVDPNTSIIFILSMLTSSPTNAIYIKNMLDNKLINVETANKLLCFTYFPSISFVIGTIGIYMFNSFKIGLILWISILLNNILIGLYLRKDKIESNNNYFNKKESLINTIKNSILKAINTSFIILGILIIFTTIINVIEKNININPIILSIISSLLEMTSGITKASSLSINTIYKIIIIFFSLSFSGLSIILQSISILNEYNINFKRILTIKLSFSFITTLFFYILNKLLLV